VRAPTAVGRNLIDSVKLAAGAIASGVGHPVKLKSPVTAMALEVERAPRCW
jgi:hypothetical protein